MALRPWIGPYVHGSDLTSRLLSRYFCCTCKFVFNRNRGSGLRKTSGSLVHSIPKFSKVRPTEKLSEVQRVLQDRILSRQRMKQQQLHQNQKDLGSSTVNGNPSEMVASNLLQNLISMQSEKNISIRNGFVHEAKSSRESSVRKRVRKPGKRLCCHLKQKLSINFTACKY